MHGESSLVGVQDNESKPTNVLLKFYIWESVGHSYCSIAKELHLDKNTVNAIVKRHKQSLIHESCLEWVEIFLQSRLTKDFSRRVAAGDSFATFTP